MASAMICANEALEMEAGEPMEWVRGNDGELLPRLSPLVREQSLLLDFSQVRRIDAAGLAVLIALYREASAAGNSFAIVNPTPHVAEILSVVGLYRVLVASCEERRTEFVPSLARSAA